MERFFLKCDLDPAIYARSWLPLYIEVEKEPLPGEIVTSRMWCPKHGDSGKAYRGKMLCCKFQDVMTNQFAHELSRREYVLDSCIDGRIVAIYDLEGYVEPIIDSAEIKTWGRNDELVTMRFFE